MSASATALERNEPVTRSSMATRCGHAVARRWLRALGVAVAVFALVHPAAAKSGGEKHLEQVQEMDALYADERWQRYLRDIGARILEHVPERGQEYHIYVLDDSSVNAMAMPGGYLFFSRGLFAYLRSEDELAAVVGHEIAHIFARHPQRSRSANWVGKSLGWLTANATGRRELWDLANVGFAALGSGYGREHELEADRLGGEFMARAGYDPMAILDVLQALQDQDLFFRDVVGRPSGYHGLFASHPKHDKRLHDALAQSQHLMSDEVREPVGDFWALVDGLVYGDEAARGVVRDSTYYHGSLRVAMEFPKGWSVTSTQSQVKGIAPGGSADASIAVLRQAPAGRKSPAKYVTEVLMRDDVTTGEELEINGAEAYIGEIDVSGSNVQLQMIGILYSRYNVFQFKGECGPKGDAEKFREQFRATMEALRPLTQADLKVANSQRVEVIVAEPGQTYAKLARDTSLNDHPEETLRLLNAGYPNGEPRAGDYIKIIK